MVDSPPEITNLDDSPLNHDILRFNVSVNNFESMEISDSLTYLSEDWHDHGLRHQFIVYFALLDEVQQLSFRRQLGYQEYRVKRAKVAVELCERRMVTIRLNFYLANELVHDVLFYDLGLVYHFQCTDESCLPMPTFQVISYLATKTEPNLPLPSKAPMIKSSSLSPRESFRGSRHDFALMDNYLLVAFVETLSLSSLGFFKHP